MAACSAQNRSVTATTTQPQPIAQVAAIERPAAKPTVTVAKIQAPAPTPAKPGRAVGLASYYGADFQGRRTANGETFDMRALTAAHPSMPLPSYARVTNLTNGKSIVVRVNDRGPYHAGRLIDVSQRTADVLGFRHAGVGNVKIDYIGRAPTGGSDDRRLLATYQEFGRPSAPEGIQVAALKPVSDSELAAEGQGTAATLVASATAVARTGVRALQTAYAAVQPAVTVTTSLGQPSAAPKPAAASEASPQPSPAAAAKPQTVPQTAPAPVAVAKAAPPKRVIQPSEPALASVTPPPVREKATPIAVAAAPAAGADVSARIAASFEGFGDPSPFKPSAGAPPSSASAFNGLR